MRQLFSRLLAVALLLMACSGVAWGDNLTVTVTKSAWTQNTKTGQESLEKALAGYTLSEVEGIEVSAGSFERDDWYWLKDNADNLNSLIKFEVTGGIGSMADIPSTTETSQYFSSSLKELHIAKLQRVGDYAFNGCTGLTSVSLPVVTEIGEGAFSGCAGLKRLQLGATPPTSVDANAFMNWPLVRELELIKPDGTALTGSGLDNAKSLYKAVNDGDTEDNLWYGWAFEEFPAGNLSGTIDGVAFTNAASLEAAMQGKTLGNVKELTITGGTFQIPDWAYLLEQGQDKLKIEQFTIENGVERVADMPDLPYESARYFPKVQQVNIAKMRKVGYRAFRGCTGLTSVSLPAATEIGASAFSGCTGLTSVSLPAATEIGASAFRGCTGLTSVSLPAATEIGGLAFGDCTVLTSVSLPGATVIGKCAFIDCKALTGVSLPAATKIDEYAFWRCTGLTSVSLPEATVVGNSAFSGCEVLTNVSLPAATKIDEYAFWRCTGLTSVSLPAATEIGGLAFGDCTVLTSVSLPAATKIDDNAFESCENLTSVSLPGATVIGKCAFIDCKALTSVSLPVAIVIGEDAFSGCEALTSVSLPVATEIGGYAFIGCTGLTSVSLPVATEIGKVAFSGCTNLTSVSLPAATKIGEKAFMGRERFTSLELGATPPSVGGDAFLGCPLVRKLKLLDADGTPLTGDALTNAISRYIAVEDGDTEDNLWYGWAFEGFPASNLSGTIDGVAFTNAASLESAMQGKTLGNVKELTITGGTFQIPDWAFLQEQGKGELKIEQFTIENGIERVDGMPDLSYKNPRYLPKAQEVTIAKMRRVGNWAFEDCTSLTSVSLPGATMIGECAFLKCKKLKSVSLPAATEIGENAFNNCTSLTSVSLPAASYIRFEAFANCSSLKTLKLGATPPSDVDAPTFENCPNERTLIITDAMGVPLVGTELKAAADNYDGKEGDPHDGKWYGWTIEKNPPAMLSVIVEPAGAGTAKITRKDGGAVVNEGDKLTKDEVLVIDAKPNDEHQYKLKEVTAKGANSNGGNEWKVTANPGEQVVFTVEFEKLATLGATTITPAGAGEVTITRKDGGAVVSSGEALKEGAVLVVEGKPENGYRVKAITAEGAKKIGDKEWEVTAMTGKVTFTVEFEKKPEGESNNPTPVESALLAQAQLSPNPTDGQVTIDAGTTLARCEVYSSTGALLQAIESPKSVFTIDLTASPSGVYLVRLVDVNGESKTLRAVKQ